MKKYSKDLSTSGGRLAYLFNTNNYNLDKGDLRKAIRKMYIDGVLQFSPVKKDKTDSKETVALKEKGQHDADITNAYNQIIRHLNNQKIEVDWLVRYCKFFNCSADYLLGIIESPLNETGLSLECISKLKRSDADTRELFSDMVESGHIKNVVSVMRSFYAIGDSIKISATNQENKKNYDKAIENIKLKMLRDSGADFIHKLAYDKKVFNYFMSNAVDIHQQKEKEFYKNMPAAFLENLERSHQEQRKSFLKIYDEIENNTNAK